MALALPRGDNVEDREEFILRARSERRNEMPRDPVCGMTVDEKNAAATASHGGTTYYFCAEACKRTFEKDPGKYVGGHGGRPAGH